MVRSDKPVLVTGATGYVGTRLIPLLVERGWRVRALGRSLEKLHSRPWAKLAGIEFAVGDVLDPVSLEKACRGCGSAFYFVHSMQPGRKHFEEVDRTAAQNMTAAAEHAGIDRLIYLSGLGEDRPDLSRHLKSRAEVGQILRRGRVPVTLLRAAMIIGSGSASFEILRYLVDRLPVMITPRWLTTPNQPIAIRNVLEYLAGCLEKNETAGQTYDIGGPDVLTYHRLMEIYAEEAGLPRRWVIPVPVLTPRLSSYWIHLVTPVPASIARPLAEGLRNPVVCGEDRIRKIIPQDLISCREAIRLALQNTREDKIESHWIDAGPLPPVEAPYGGDPSWAGGTLFTDRRILKIQAPVSAVWKTLAAIGGRRGWYHADWLWSLRGFLDRIAGGVGLRRGRRADHEIRPGDALDFWRVLKADPGKCLLLYAEMKLPGRATLEFSIQPVADGCELQQTASFRPHGLAGILYWYLALPFHHYVFHGMLRGIARTALREK